ncbi:MAG: hypothetical protein C0426_02440 [Rhodobacter sp.]|nr:hypothetical protein [Rhodobacter sp.]
MKPGFICIATTGSLPKGADMLAPGTRTTGVSASLPAPLVEAPGGRVLGRGLALAAQPHSG